MNSTSPGRRPSLLFKILLVAGVAFVVFLVVVALRAGEYRVTRSTSVSAPAATVFGQVNELKKWEGWSPWARMDPTMKQIYEGPGSGEGASYAWEGNSQVGEGRMTIVESRPGELIRIQLEFIRPFAGVCPTEFTFRPEGGETVVTWTMTGTNSFLFKAVGLFLNTDQMVGGQFEQGLAAIKSIVEGAPKP